MNTDDAAFGGNSDAFWSAVDIFQASLGLITDSGAVATYDMSPTSLQVFSVVIPGGDPAVVQSTLGPLISRLGARGVSLNVTARSFDSFWDFHSTVYGAAEAATHSGQVSGGRLVPRSIVENPRSLAKLSESFRSATKAGFQVSCTAVNAGVKANPAHANAVLPLWRSSLLSCLVFKFWDYGIEWDANYAIQRTLTRDVMPIVISATPGGGAYLNEANFEEPEWQRAFYGSNYARLERIKNKFDPQSLLYARTAVGSEKWAEDKNHRLCKVV